MSGAGPLPRIGEVFFDARGADRALRLSRHPGTGVVVISLWKSGICTGTFRLPDADLPAFLATLTEASTADLTPTDLTPTDLTPAGLEPADLGRDDQGRADRPSAVRGPLPDRRVFPVTDEHRLPPLP